MERISPRLHAVINAAGPEPVQEFRVIVTLGQEADWNLSLRQIKGAGLKIAGREEAVRAVFGSADVNVIQRLATMAAVELIEPDEQARSLH